jgi:hypothetical protein
MAAKGSQPTVTCMYPWSLAVAVAASWELMSGAIPTSCPPGADAPEETTLLPLGQCTVPVTGTLVVLPQKDWVTYWMGWEAGTSADAGAADKASPQRWCPRPRRPQRRYAGFS